jgi:DNA-directed RNA polymerase subunit RPC12/RpoP
MAPEAESPTQATAQTFPCSQCGADLVWSPTSNTLKCPYCGFTQEVSAADNVAEKDLQAAVAPAPLLGWGSARKSYRCSCCGAVQSLPPELKASSCAFCGTPAVLELPENQKLLRPQGVLPFRISRQQALEQFRGWLRSLWFRPNQLAERAELEGIRGVYVPFFTFDADTVTHWTAESGQRVGSGKNARILWTPVAGTLVHRFDDLPVPASRGLNPALAQELEPFPTQQLLAYDASFLSGFLAEEYGLSLEEAWRRAHERMQQTLYAACRAEVPGDLCRNLKLQTKFSGEKFKTGLLPIWVAAYRYGNRSFQYLVNGATGKAAGTAPWSWVKIGLAILVALILLLWLFSS